jgi:sugar-specific transcriptional regulator TrmB
MFEKYLQDIGLNEKEALVYLALLQVDAASVADLAKKTKIKRPTVYVVLKGLMKKGLASEIQVGKKIHYQAEPPERLETFVERQKTVLEEQQKRLKDIIPQLKGIERELGERPIIKFFEGRDGSISAHEEFYSFTPEKEEKGYFIFNRDLLEETFTPEELEKYKKIRFGKSVTPITVYTRERGDFSFTSPGTRARIDSHRYPILADITIIEDRVVATTLAGSTASILIKSKDIATTLASLVQYINDTQKEKGGR